MNLQQKMLAVCLGPLEKHCSESRAISQRQKRREFALCVS